MFYSMGLTTEMLAELYLISCSMSELDHLNGWSLQLDNDPPPILGGMLFFAHRSIASERISNDHGITSLGA